MKILEREAKRLRGFARFRHFQGLSGMCRVREEGHAGHMRKRLIEQLETLAAQVWKR